MTDYVRIIWPVERLVSGDEMLQHLRDTIDNGDISWDWHEADPMVAANLLEDHGLLTVSSNQQLTEDELEMMDCAP